MMVAILGGELRSGMGSVLSGRTLSMKIYPPTKFAAHAIMRVVGRGASPTSSKAFQSLFSSD
jgi:hypothetical protein